MQPITVFFFLISTISIKDVSVSFGLLRLRPFLNLYFSDLSIYSRAFPFDDLVVVY